jgi:signal transduction histidine kinase
MNDRRRSIRVKIAALLLVPVVSLVAIWGFAATITVQRGQQLLQISTVFEDAIVPTRALVTALQHERQLSLAYLSGGSQDRSRLDGDRAKTDAAQAAMEELGHSADRLADLPPAMRQRLVELDQHVHRLTEIRSRVDTGAFTPMQTLAAYNGLVDAAFRVYDKMKISPDIEMIDQTRAVIVVGRSREMLSRQSALLFGAVAADRMTGEAHTAFRELVTSRRLLYTTGFEQLDEELRAPYIDLQSSSTNLEFERIEDEIVKSVRPDRPLPAAAGRWPSVVETLAETFDAIGGQVSAKIADRATPLATAILVQIAVAGGLGLIAVVASVFISLRFGRRIGAELVELQQAALDLADRRLPHVVERLRRGEDVDVREEAPAPGTGTTTEIAKVSEAFASVQRTAVQAAVGQAELRKGVGKVFLNLARRSQSLLHRQLTMLEAMERRTSEPEDLNDLFALDHLTTRMRRHSEGLIILSGSVPARGWRNPVALFDVVRAAVEEVEDYLRVSVQVPAGPALVGSAVTDVIHLVAELVENATIFSPPHTPVHVRGEMVARGFALEVEDRGLGMGPAEFAQVNARLADPPEFDLADSDRLGLFVVAKLAGRHGITVSLRPSPYGGTTAIVLLPAELVVEAADPAGPGRATYSVEEDPGAADRHVPAREPGAPDGRDPFGPGPVETVAPVSSRTTTGLPKRVRQANLAPQLRDPAPPADSSPDEPASGSLLTSFQAGWRRAEQEDPS